MPQSVSRSSCPGSLHFVVARRKTRSATARAQSSSKTSRKARPRPLLVDPQHSLVALRIERILRRHHLAAEQPPEPPGVEVAARERLRPEMLPERRQERRVRRPVERPPVGIALARLQRRHPAADRPAGSRTAGRVPGSRPGKPRCFSMAARRPPAQPCLCPFAQQRNVVVLLPRVRSAACCAGWRRPAPPGAGWNAA